MASPEHVLIAIRAEGQDGKHVLWVDPLTPVLRILFFVTLGVKCALYAYTLWRKIMFAPRASNFTPIARKVQRFLSHLLFLPLWRLDILDMPLTFHAKEVLFLHLLKKSTMCNKGAIDFFRLGWWFRALMYH